MRILNFAKRNLKELLRDPLGLVFTILLPLFLLFIFQQFNIPNGINLNIDKDNTTDHFCQICHDCESSDDLFYPLYFYTSELPSIIDNKIHIRNVILFKM